MATTALTKVTYHVSCPDPHTHRFHVKAVFPHAAGPLRVKLPAWNPGSYLVRDFVSHLNFERAEDSNGNALQFHKDAKNAWVIPKPSPGSITVTYTIFAHELTVRSSHLDATHAFFNGATLFLFAEEQRELPVELILDFPADWRISTGLPRAQGDLSVFHARNYDHLVDCPVEAGHHALIEFSVNGIPHEVAIWGAGNYDPAVLQHDLASVVQVASEIMGGLPYERYLFIVHLGDKRSGGLEHENSSVLSVGRFSFRPRRDYEEFVLLAAHEHFHAWNVKRIRPQGLTPYNYDQENYTNLLWAMEGLTDYYALLICRRAAIFSSERTLAILGEWMTKLARTPGRFVQSLEQSSYDAWVRLYRPSDDSINRTISYYLKGSLVGCVLDAEIRRRTGDKFSLDDVMRLLAKRAADGKPLPEGGFGTVVRDATSVSVDDLLEKYVSGVSDIQFAEHLGSLGVSVRVRAQEGPEDIGGWPSRRRRKGDEAAEQQPHLGAVLAAGASSVSVVSVPTGSPAARDGLYAGDEIVAVDGWRVKSPKDVDDRICVRAPGEHASLTIFRRDQLIAVPVGLGVRPTDTFWVEVREDASPEEKGRLTSWLDPLLDDAQHPEG